VAHPVIDEELPSLALLQHRFTEAAECMEAHACSPHILEYGLVAGEWLRGPILSVIAPQK
jgi:hypothetical protein